MNDNKKRMTSFTKFGIGSVVAIALGLFARDFLGEEISNILLFGGVIFGCINTVIAVFSDTWRGDI